MHGPINVKLIQCLLLFFAQSAENEYLTLHCVSPSARFFSDTLQWMWAQFLTAVSILYLAQLVAVNPQQFLSL
jgi:hypothetical protein